MKLLFYQDSVSTPMNSTKDVDNLVYFCTEAELRRKLSDVSEISLKNLKSNVMLLMGIIVLT